MWKNLPTPTEVYAEKMKELDKIAGVMLVAAYQQTLDAINYAAVNSAAEFEIELKPRLDADCVSLAKRFFEHHYVPKMDAHGSNWDVQYETKRRGAKTYIVVTLTPKYSFGDNTVGSRQVFRVMGPDGRFA